MVLVTGGTGLVGSHLIFNLLNKGYKVKALVRKTSNKEAILHTFEYYSSDAKHLFEQIIWVEGDLMDIASLEDALEDVTKIYHAAALVSFNPYNKKKIIETNVDGTANLVNLCLSKNIEKLCFVSSIASLGNTDDNSFITENVLWKPKKHDSSYSISKFKSEMEVWRGITEGLNAVIVNPSVILGPGNRKKGNLSLLDNIPRILPFYTEGVTGFVDVRDVTEIMINLMESDINKERFILSSENISYKILFNAVAAKLNLKPSNIYFSPLLGSIIWRFATLKSFLFHSSNRLSRFAIENSHKKFYYSSEKVKNTVNFIFRPVQQTIEEFASLPTK
jgi:dihydroflavonol-4-reductase